MAKKSVRKSTKQLAPEARGKQSTGAYPVEPDELEAQQRRLKKAAAAGAEGLTSTVPAPTPDLHPAPTMALSKPLTPLAALWPKPTASAGAGQPLKLPAQAKSLEKATVAQVPTPPASPRVKVNFVLPAPAAKHVSLSGEFNGWSPEATAMKRRDDGRWETTLALAPGRYQYKFVVDGQWIPDPHAHENVSNPHGTINSVVVVRT